MVCHSLSLYIHIPFCISKCGYCDFLSYPIKNSKEINNYISALLQDIKISTQSYLLQTIYSEKPGVSTIYIGGGSPNLLPTWALEQIFEQFNKYFDINADTEISIELNPAKLGELGTNCNSDYSQKTWLRKLKKLGVNRISIGFQSLDDKILKILERSHSAEDAENYYQLVREAEFENVNIDLIYGIPYQTLDIWFDTLNEVITLKPEHISMYCLEMPFKMQNAECNTPPNPLSRGNFCRMQSVKKDEVRGMKYEIRNVQNESYLIPRTSYFSITHQTKCKTQNIKLSAAQELPEEIVCKMYYDAAELLKNKGWKRYEISNFARKGFKCRHNINYWENNNYLGFGLGAVSYINRLRFKKEPSLKEYEKLLKQGCLPFKTGEKLSAHKRFIEDIMLNFRTLNGIKISELYNWQNINNKHTDLSLRLKFLSKKGFIKIKNNEIYISDKNILLLNEIITELLL